LCDKVAMSSTFSSSSTTLDRKALKRPDGFMSALTAAFDKIASRSNIFVIVVAGLLGLGLLGAFFMNRLEARSDSARNALFLATQSMRTELKAISDLEKPKAAPVDDKKTPNTAPDAGVAFKKFDVDAKLPETVKKLKDIDQNFGRTRSAFEARLKLGDLYFNHGEFSKALPWYEKAVGSATGNFEKTLALSSLGYANESLEKPADALQAFQKAVNLGEGSLKGDLLLGVARSYEAVHDSAKARSTYDKILVELPNTEYAKSAEVFKGQL